MATSERITIGQLESYLWGAATYLRGTIDAGDYKQFIFPLLFFKRICDVYDEEFAQALEESGGDADFAAFAENHRFQIPEAAHWRDVREVPTNIGQALQKAMRAIETANPDRLYGIFGDANWGNKERLSDATLRDLLEHYSSLTLSVANVPEDELGVAYEFLIKKFADDSGHTAAEFYTNRTVVHLMTLMLEPQEGEAIYDPTCGSGGMLLSCAVEVKRQEREWRNLKLYGQERNLLTSAIARMNLFLHGFEDFHIVRGDTLSDPKFLDGDRLRQFDMALANPPYSIKAWDRKKWENDPFGRNLYGTPPQGRADYAFWQHILASLNPDTGRCAILFPHGVLFRMEEQEMREKTVKADVIEAVIGLGPNLFYNSPMEACIIVCRTRKPEARRGRIRFIDAKDEVTRERAQSFLTEEHIARIISAYRADEDVEGFARAVGMDEIVANRYNLSLPLYIRKNGARSEEAISLAEVADDWESSAATLRAAMNDLFLALEADPPSEPGSPSGIVATNLDESAVVEQAFRLCGQAASKDGWRRVMFGDAVKCVNESCADPAAQGLERVVGLEHLDPEDLRIKRWADIAEGTSFSRVFRKGQMLFGKRRAYQRKAALADFDGICSGDILVFEVRPDILLPELLPFIVQSEGFFEHALGTSAGSLSPRTRWSDLAGYEFDLPPLEEQRRIADILWELESARRSWAAAATDAQALRASTLQTYFSELGVGESTPLSEVAQVRTGLAKGKRYQGVPTTDRPYLRVANVQDGFLDLTEVKMIEVPVEEVERYMLEVGDVLITEGGDFDKVGRGTIWHGQVTCCLHQNHIFAVRTDKNRLLPEYLAMHLDSAYGKTYFLNCAKKTSNLASINSTQVRAFPVRLAPLEVQRERCARVRLIDDTVQELTRHEMSILALVRTLRSDLLAESCSEKE